jgi:hypothetical protein
MHTSLQRHNRYKLQFLQYATGELPSEFAGSAFSSDNDCLWNSPGNEGQEQSLSGEGCRTLIQSLMYGESSALAELCAAIGDDVGAKEMSTEADKWQQRVLRLWNPAIDSFDTLRFGHPPKPPSPPPPPPPPAPPGWRIMPDHNGTFCCDQSPCVNGHSTFLYQASERASFVCTTHIHTHTHTQTHTHTHTHTHTQTHTHTHTHTHTQTHTHTHTHTTHTHTHTHTHHTHTHCSHPTTKSTTVDSRHNPTRFNTSHAQQSFSPRLFRGPTPKATVLSSAPQTQSAST